ncbi:expressed unknown protein [Seminavis robusta]|uniref:Trigger factor ribosome-binding bacterial domain-containing protein n=1 Tax=Seminavis robusta TaxID=568900 RepID=A0A9N8EZU6_9STRA|nr:expressed unknown protein [Seminavis robusta]|eukprot:Sro2318_g323030.1 n/a (250) ;mRNA; f:1876-2832
MVGWRFLNPLLLWIVCGVSFCLAWAPSHKASVSGRSFPVSLQSSSLPWNGEVVSNTADGTIKGCSVQPVGNEPHVEWIIKIDGVEADLGRFSDAIYKKVTADAKKERFQGFRPGTIPPHIEPTYRAFAMDECARETVLEAMQQNNIRPFENTRAEFELENFFIPPPSKKGNKKKKKKKSKKSNDDTQSAVVEEIPGEPKWRQFDSMKEALDAGWRPGQSFSFVAKNVKGQKVLGEKETQGATAIGGLGY